MSPAPTPTPRTAAALMATQGMFRASAAANGFADFARQLELELAAANAELAKIREREPESMTHDQPLPDRLREIQDRCFCAGLVVECDTVSEAIEVLEQAERLAGALEAVTRLAECRICLHENTHRGGIIWEICDECGVKWADDKGGKPADAHEYPKEIVEARKELAAWKEGRA